jgi:hypothetical protein
MNQMCRPGSTKRCGTTLTSVNAPGGIMQVKQKIIAPVVIALGAAGSILAGSAVAVTAASAPATAVAAAHPAYYYYA